MSFVFRKANFEMDDYLENVRDQAKFEQDPEAKYRIKELLEAAKRKIEDRPDLLMGWLFLEMVFSQGYTMYTLHKEFGYPKMKILREMAKTKRYLKSQMLLTKNHFRKD